jgi:hypothetical protein
VARETVKWFSEEKGYGFVSLKPEEFGTTLAAKILGSGNLVGPYPGL